ncbi:MAG: valine--tRNA ligase, partial [Candidatus Omnitrophica bacterium]|nr:valine--tRNA ligase [Candidatus Omnitrophota bacterium]
MEIPNQYNPKGIEEKWYKFWLEKNYFHAESDSKKPPYVIVIPPPNITGSLHMGHALNNIVQDIIIRYKKMSGFNCLWLPGTDHAGIATQNMVEKMLLKRGVRRDDLGREKFLEKVWEWKRNYGSRITEQLKRLGASCDWSRERFTMDEGLSSAVTEAFVWLYRKNLIYRGNYIINWCPRCETALSDEEADHKEEEGFLYYIKYPFAEGGSSLTVATTRPETMFGDTAVAVNPKDKRYKNLIGKELLLPLTERKIPVISHHLVDPDFGTGAVKVTPAHDPNDFLIGREEKLEFITAIDTKGRMNREAGKFEGLERFECRRRAIEELKKINLFEKKELHHYSIGHCYRCDTIIEPYLSRQWFVRMKPLAKEAIIAARKEKPKFYPERWKKVYLNWLENIRDWCISRQIWWGHRLPVYYCKKCQEADSLKLKVKSRGRIHPTRGLDESSPYMRKFLGNKFTSGIIVSREKPEKCPVCGNRDLVQEQDVLDTWFSSWLWPFSTLGWPGKTKDLKLFYPTDTLVTAPEIIFFWVARMVIAGIEFEQRVPFSSVYIHGTVRDNKGRKMSKSLGNAIDPLQIIDEVGADSLRYSIVLITATGQDLFLGKDTFNLGRNFCNKIWNASRFILGLGVRPLHLTNLPSQNLSLPERWILTKLNLLIEEVTKSLNSFRFNEAAHSLYEFFWHQFCDWYLEIAKVNLRIKDSELRIKDSSAILAYVLENSLRLLHPFMPFITEEIWQRLKKTQNSHPHLLPPPLRGRIKEGGSIMMAEWPKSNKELIDKNSLAEMDILIEVVVAIRDLRARFHIKPSQEIAIILVARKKEGRLLIENSLYLKALCRLKELKIEK